MFRSNLTTTLLVSIPIIYIPTKLFSAFIKLFGLAFFLILLTALSAQAGAIRSGFNADSLLPNDDGSSAAAVPLGFTVNFFGTNYNSLYINNGNVSFGNALSVFTPVQIGNTGYSILAPFWADVDTRGSGTVSYGVGAIDGKNAFGVNWLGVGYFNVKTDKLNSFQLILIDRSERREIEFRCRSRQIQSGDTEIQRRETEIRCRCPFKSRRDTQSTFHDAREERRDTARASSNT